MPHNLPPAPTMHRLPPCGEFSTVWRHRSVDWPATAVFPRKGYRLMEERPARILRISEGDAILRMTGTDGIGETFYIQLDIAGSPTIPCWVIRRSPTAVYAHFHLRLTSEVLDGFEETYAIRASLETLFQDPS